MTNTFRLGDIAVVFNGKTPAKSEQRSEGYPVLKIRDVDEEGAHRGAFGSYVDDQLAQKYRSKWIVPGDTLILNAAHNADYVGSKTFFAGDSVANALPTGEWLIVRPGERASAAYVNFWLRSRQTRDRIRFAVKGIHLYPKDVAALEISLPLLEEQRRMVDLLSRAEGIVRLRREAQRKAAELVPALFLDMFGDPASNPKAWQTVSLSEVSTVGSGAGFPIADQGRDTGDYPFYKVGDMNLPGNEEAMASSRNYIDEATRSRLRATAFPPGAVIFPKIGAAIATNKKRVLSIPSCVDNNVMAVVPSDRLLSSYLHALFMHADLSDFASDSNPPSIRKTTIEAWRIPLPPVDLQRQFAAKADAVRGIAAQQTAALATAQATFDALLHQSFQH